MKNILLIMVIYLFVGAFYSAYQSHIDPERYQRCVSEGVLFWFE